jgi:hypothetical protein
MHVLRNTKIRSREYKEDLKKLDDTFNKKDIFREDDSMPNQTKIYASKALHFLKFIISIVIITVEIYLITTGTNHNYIRVLGHVHN